VGETCTSAVGTVRRVDEVRVGTMDPVRNTGSVAVSVPMPMPMPMPMCGVDVGGSTCGSTTAAAQVVGAVAYGDAVADGVSHNVVVAFVTAFEHDKLSSWAQTDREVTREFSNSLISPKERGNMSLGVRPNTGSKSASRENVVVVRNKLDLGHDTREVEMEFEYAIREANYRCVGYERIESGVQLGRWVGSGTGSRDSGVFRLAHRE